MRSLSGGYESVRDEVARPAGAASVVCIAGEEDRPSSPCPTAQVKATRTEFSMRVVLPWRDSSLRRFNSFAAVRVHGRRGDGCRRQNAGATPGAVARPVLGEHTRAYQVSPNPRRRTTRRGGWVVSFIGSLVPALYPYPRRRLRTQRCWHFASPRRARCQVGGDSPRWVTEHNLCRSEHFGTAPPAGTRIANRLLPCSGERRRAISRPRRNRGGWVSPDEPTAGCSPPVGDTARRSMERPRRVDRCHSSPNGISASTPATSGTTL
jgi:hypothetical protein